jgi:hypothetical protein
MAFTQKQFFQLLKITNFAQKTISFGRKDRFRASTVYI